MVSRSGVRVLARTRSFHGEDDPLTAKGPTVTGVDDDEMLGMGWVYIMEIPTRHLKIGVPKNHPTWREPQLTTGRELSISCFGPSAPRMLAKLNGPFTRRCHGSIVS